MGVSLKTENEEYAGMTSQIRGSESGRRGLPASGGAEGDQGFTGTCPEGNTWRVPLWPSARLTHGLKLDTVVWLLRCSVFRETPMAFSCDYFKKLGCYS
jgi:hypothetical protein